MDLLRMMGLCPSQEVMDNSLDEYMMGYGKKLMSLSTAKRSGSAIMDGVFLWARYLMPFPK